MVLTSFYIRKWSCSATNSIICCCCGSCLIQILITYFVKGPQKYNMETSRKFSFNMIEFINVSVSNSLVVSGKFIWLWNGNIKDNLWILESCREWPHTEDFNSFKHLITLYQTSLYTRRCRIQIRFFFLFPKFIQLFCISYKWKIHRSLLKLSELYANYIPHQKEKETTMTL